jgi:hypothetical protein
MPWDVRNPLKDIAHLEINDTVTNSSFTTSTEFRLELRTGNHSFDLGEARVFVGFSRMTLQLRCFGTEIAIGDRHGDYTPINDVVTKVARETNAATKTGAKVGVGFDAATALSGIPVKAAASAEALQGTTEKRKTAIVDMSKHVTAKPNDKWEISTLDKKTALGAKYITTNQPLCTINPKEKQNRTGVQAHLYAHKNDMVISTDEEPSTWSIVNPHKKNKERVLTILLGKSLTGDDDGLNPKTQITLSAISSFDPNDE